jgi:prefoldin subunit 5
MVSTRTSSRYEANGAQDIVGGMQDLREWFDRLRRTAAEGEALLEQIAPQIHAFAARIAELEEVAARIEEVEELVDRWKGIKGATSRAA